MFESKYIKISKFHEKDFTFDGINVIKRGYSLNITFTFVLCDLISKDNPNNHLSKLS
jgi:hypothetical protein